MFSGRFKPFSCSSMCYNVIRIIILISIIILIKKVQHNNDDNKSVLPSYLPAVLKSHLPSNRPSGLLPSSRDTVPLSFRLIETVRHLSYNPPPPFHLPNEIPSYRRTYHPTVLPFESSIVDRQFRSSTIVLLRSSNHEFTSDRWATTAPNYRRTPPHPVLTP